MSVLEPEPVRYAQHRAHLVGEQGSSAIRAGLERVHER